MTELITIPGRWEFDYTYFAGESASRFFRELGDNRRRRRQSGADFQAGEDLRQRVRQPHLEEGPQAVRPGGAHEIDDLRIDRLEAGNRGGKLRVFAEIGDTDADRLGERVCGAERQCAGQNQSRNE